MKGKLYTEAEVLNYAKQAVINYAAGCEKGIRDGLVISTIASIVIVSLTCGITKKLKAILDSKNQNH